MHPCAVQAEKVKEIETIVKAEAEKVKKAEADKAEAQKAEAQKAEAEMAEAEKVAVRHASGWHGTKGA
jgi:hypothetical protein